jgi:hypothetical protein
VPPKSTPHAWNAAYGHFRRGPRTEFGPGEKRAVQHLTKRLRLGAGVSVIELGGGGGSFLLPFARLGCSCFSLDFSDAGLNAARRLFSQEGHALETISGDLMNPDPQLLGRFDVVVSYGLCEHFQGQDRTAVIRAHAQLMKAGGVSLISVPNRASPFYQIWSAAARFLTFAGQARRFDVNIVEEWAFTSGELTRRCREAGLDDVTVIGNPLAGDAIDMLARPIAKFLRRLGGRDYRRPPMAQAFRSPLDDLFGSYLYCVAAEGRAPAAAKNSSLDTANRRADHP